MTRVAVSAGENCGLDSPVSPHFEHCPYFVLVDVEEGKVKSVHAVSNPYHSQRQPGWMPGCMLSQRVDVVLSGEGGERGDAFLEQYGIQTMTLPPSRQAPIRRSRHLLLHTNSPMQPRWLLPLRGSYRAGKSRNGERLRLARRDGDGRAQ